MSKVAAQESRLASVDILRGFTIALMILVNDPGDWAHTYAQLDHAAWNGFTLTDFVFPNFLFLVGVSIILSMQARISRAGGGLDGAMRRALALRIIRRAVLLYGIGVFLSAFPHFHWVRLRLFGVLPRISVCYMTVALLCLYTRRASTLLTAVAGLLLGYWALMRFVPVPLGMHRSAIPTLQVPILDPVRNLAATFDRAFVGFTQRWLDTGTLYNGNRDPEGLLSTLPSIATTLIGCLAGLVLAQGEWVPRGRSGLRAASKNAGLFLLAGAACMGAGLLWNPWFPINKNLWTSSYVLFAGGCSLSLLGVCHWLFDVRRLHEGPVGRAVTLPWRVFGSNAISAFVFAELTVEILLAVHIPNSSDPGHPLPVWIWIYRTFFAVHGSTSRSSLTFAVAYTAVCLVPAYLLYRRRIFLKL